MRGPHGEPIGGQSAMGKQWRRWAGIAALAAGAAASPAIAKKSQRVVTEAEIRAADQAALQCLAQQVTQLDDGRTDATVVARVATNMCSGYRANFVALIAASVGRRVDLSPHLQAAAQRDVETATYFVLKRRAARR